MSGFPTRRFDKESSLYFWTRDKPSSTAEVDYVSVIGNRIVPIEVKAGTTGQLKSLKIFMAEKKIDMGIRISQLPLKFENSVLSLPIYMVGEMPRLVQMLKNL